MDGYAVRSKGRRRGIAEAPVVLRLSGEIAAGGTAAGAVEPGAAVKIMTGAPVPPRADAVVPWEDTAEADGTVAGARARRRGPSRAAGR